MTQCFLSTHLMDFLECKFPKTWVEATDRAVQLTELPGQDGARVCSLCCHLTDRYEHCLRTGDVVGQALRPATQSSGADRSQAGASTSERSHAPWAPDGSSQRPVSHAHRHQSGAARYGGPYPGSVPGTSGRVSADAPAAGAIVRGRGITIRLPGGAAAPQPPPQSRFLPTHFIWTDCKAPDAGL